MNLSPTAYIALVGSLIAAVLLDYATVRLALEFLRPTSAYVFLIGRAGKLLSVVAWLFYFHNYWYPQFQGAGRQPAPPASYAEMAFAGVVLLLAGVTLPRAARVRRHGNA